MLPFLVIAVVIAAIAAITDLKTGRIPNVITLGGIAVGIVGHSIQGWRQGGMHAALVEGGVSLAGLVFCSFAPAFMYWKGGMGGGDLKLFAAIGALCHPMLGIEIQMYSLVAAAVLAQARLAYQGRLLRTLGGSLALLINPFRSPEKRREPPPEAMAWFRMGPTIFLGALLALVIHIYAHAPA